MNSLKHKRFLRKVLFTIKKMPEYGSEEYKYIYNYMKDIAYDEDSGVASYEHMDVILHCFLEIDSWDNEKMISIKKAARKVMKLYYKIEK